MFKIIPALLLLAVMSCSSSNETPPCKSNADCTAIATPFCNVSSGICEAQLCQGNPLYFMADNSGQSYAVGAAPFGTNAVSPNTSYASLDQECSNQAAKLGTNFNKLTWKAIVLLPENGNYSAEAVVRNNIFWNNLANVPSGQASNAYNPVDCTKSNLVRSSDKGAVPTNTYMWFGFNDSKATVSTALPSDFSCNYFSSPSYSNQATNIINLPAAKNLGLVQAASTVCSTAANILCAAQY
ncbi:MAG: hypothetical protein V4534_04305 [Myxococcota bacterium]